MSEIHPKAQRIGNQVKEDTVYGEVLIMKKRVFMITAICFLLTGLFLCGCSQQQQSEQQQPAETQQPEQVSLQLSLEEYPVMDGSTANLPMMA